jgi:hypothetical protein
MAIDLEVLTWNMAFGLVSSYSWDALGPATIPWLDLVARLQRDFGPRYVGVALSGYRNLAPDVNQSTFGDLAVVANRAASRYSTAGYDIAPGGFLARTTSNDLLAGAFAGSFDSVPLSAGVHYVIVERGAASVTVLQPVGADSDLAVEPPATSSAGRSLTATALASDGTAVGTVGGRLQDGHFVFPYAGTLNGRAVAAYRVSVAGP